MDWLFLLKGLGAGVIGGFLSGLTGMGGGGVFVPMFYFVFGLPVKSAMGTSLLVVMFTAVSAGVGHWRAGRVYFPVAVTVSCFGIAGAQAGAFVAGAAPDVVMKGFFVSLTLVLAVKMWLQSPETVYPAAGGGAKNPACKWWAVALVGVAGGFASAMGGVGGAVLIVPLLHFVAKMPMSYCIGTTLVVVVVNSVSGSIGYYLHGHMDFSTGVLVAAGAVASAPFGAKLSMRLAQESLRRVFAVILLLAGGLMLLNR